MKNVYTTSDSSINPAGEIHENVAPREELVLLALYGKELYGLQIPKAMEEASGKRHKLSIGSLYPTLHGLEEKGLIESRWGDEGRAERGGARRRYYKLTRSGIATIDFFQSFRASLLDWNPV
jgi:PadR family transcriptional regulator, regulatory protein PadR